MSSIQPMFKDQSVQTENDSVEAVIELIQHYCDKLLDIINKNNGDIVLPTHIDKLHIIRNSLYEVENYYRQYCEHGELNMIYGDLFLLNTGGLGSHNAIE